MRAALRRLVGWAPAVRAVAADAVLAASLSAVSVLQGMDDPPGPWRPYDGTAAVLTVLATLPTVVRRRAPLPVLLVCVCFWCWLAVVGYSPVSSSYGLLLALYTVATVHPWPRVLACTALLCGVWVAQGVAGGQTAVPTLVAQGVLVPAVVWKVGDSAKRLTTSNRRLAAAGKALAGRAVLAERVRIARELHDVVAHHLSVITVQAGLARYVLRSDPDTAHTALDTVLDTGREALHELRRLLELLRLGSSAAGGDPAGATPDAGPDPTVTPYEPAPGLAHLPELFNRVRGAGVPVRITVTGPPQPLSPGLELCAYRIIQESLTNVLRYAQPATARVTLHHGPGELRVTVTDDGAGPGRPSGGTGTGLMGMRERAMLYGGRLDAGPRPGGGFEVRLWLPVTPQARPT